MLRMNDQRPGDYREVKTFLLSEFQLTPFQFKSSLENTKRKCDET